MPMTEMTINMSIMTLSSLDLNVDTIHKQSQSQESIMSALAHAIRHSCNRLRHRRPQDGASSESRAVPLRVRLTGLGFNLASLLNTDHAAEWLSDFWFRVFQPKPRDWVPGFWHSADRSIELHLHDKTLPVYSWGEGPLVVCMHGWGGSGTQFRRLIPQLVASGYRVVTFDAPAHGLNPGKHTHVLEFAQCLTGIEEQIGAIDTVVAHSFGAMATLTARYHGLAVPRLVMLAPGLDVNEIFTSYHSSLRLNDTLARRFRHRVGEKMAAIAMIDDPWTFFSPEPMLQHAPERGLMIYDRCDEELSLQQFHDLAVAWPELETMETEGLGHYRLLKDPTVIQRVVDWMKRTD